MGGGTWRRTCGYLDGRHGLREHTWATGAPRQGSEAPAVGCSHAPHAREPGKKKKGRPGGQCCARRDRNPMQSWQSSKKSKIALRGSALNTTPTTGLPMRARVCVGSVHMKSEAYCSCSGRTGARRRRRRARTRRWRERPPDAPTRRGRRPPSRRLGGPRRARRRRRTAARPCLYLAPCPSSSHPCP